MYKKLMDVPETKVQVTREHKWEYTLSPQDV